MLTLHFSPTQRWLTSSLPSSSWPWLGIFQSEEQFHLKIMCEPGNPQALQRAQWTRTESQKPSTSATALTVIFFRFVTHFSPSDNALLHKFSFLSVISLQMIACGHKESLSRAVGKGKYAPTQNSLHRINSLHSSFSGPAPLPCHKLGPPPVESLSSTNHSCCHKKHRKGCPFTQR